MSIRKATRKFISVALSATTAVWLTGALALVPVTASAQALTLGDLVELLISLDIIEGDKAAAARQAVANLGGGGSTGGGGGSCTFTRSLTLGSQGSDVLCLQQYLNGAGFTLASSGVGSPGNETDYFGNLTRGGVANWQAANGVSPAVGYFGPISQAKYNQVAGGTPPPAVPPPAGPPPPASVGSGLTVSPGSQPSDTLFVQGTINVPFTRVRLTASSDGDVTVDSVTVERTGLMADTAFSGVVLLDENGIRINQVSKSLSSTHTATINDDFVVKAGQSRVITIAGDAAADLSGRVGEIGYLSLVSVNTSATVNGSLPITGAGHTANSSLGSKIGSVNLTVGSLDPASGRTKEVGSTGYIFTSIKATASNEDVLWTSATFNQSGSMGLNDFGNLVALDDDGNTYPLVSSDNGKYYTADFGSGILIEKGKNAEISVRGDFVDGSARTSDFDIFRYEDLVFHGQTYDYDIKPTSAAGDSTQNEDNGEFSSSTNPIWDAYEAYTNNGSLVVSKDNSVASGNVAADGDGVELGAFEFEAKGEPITFTQWVLTIATTNNDSDTTLGELTNVTVYDQNGSAVAGPIDFVKTAVTLTDSVTVPVGKNVFTVKGDLDSSFETNDTIITSFTPSSAISSVTGDTTGNTITPSPSSTVTGPTMTVKAGTVTISRSGSFASTTKIANGTDVEVGRYILDGNGSGDDVKITVAKLVKKTNSGNTLSRLRLKDITDSNNPILLTSGSNEVSLTSTNPETLTFNLDSDKEVVVAKGSSKVIGLFADISSTATTDSYYQFVLHANGTAAAWTAKTVGDGNSVTPTQLDLAAGGVTLKTSGGYSVAADASRPSETWVAGGTSNVTLNVLKFKATSEAMNITDLRLQLDTTGSSTGADFTKVEIWADGAVVASKISPAFNNGVEDFQFSIGDLTIPKDGEKKVTIKADLADIALNQAGTAGQLVGIDYDGRTEAALSGKQKATGVDSGSSVHSSTQSDQTGNGVVTFRAIPVVSKESHTTAAAGQTTLYKFSVKAEGGDIKLNRVTARIVTSGVTKINAAANVRWYSIDKSDYVSTATAAEAAYFSHRINYDSSDSLIVRLLANNTAGSAVSTNGEYEISAGDTDTFEVRIDVPFSDDSTAGGSITSTIMDDDARPVNVVLTGASALRMANVDVIDVEQGSQYGAGAAAASSTAFIWSDLSSEATSSSNTNSRETGDWMNGFKVGGLVSGNLESHTLSF